MSKRILSLVLALVMVLGTFGTVFAAETAAVTVEKEAAAFLALEKILLGDDKGNLNLDLKLERRDMVILLSRLMGEEEVASKFPVSEDSPTWEDVRSDAYYLNFFAWGETNKFFAGKTVKEFGPRDAMTAQDYSVVLLRALGYEADGHEAWKTALADAKKLGILKDVVVEDATEITRGQMSVMTFNALGTNVKDSTKTLAETLGIEMPEATELKIEKVYADNLKEIIIELSNAELANKEKLENINNYKLSGNEIERIEVKDNDVLVQVKNVLKDGREYELLIKNVEKAIDGKHKFVARDNAIPAVVEVEALGEYGIKVITSEPISDIRSNNFLIDGKNITMDVEQYGRTIILTPYRGSFSNDAKTLTIEGLKDFAGFKSVKEDFDIEIVKDEVAPKVVDVILKGDTVEVTFDKDIYKSSVGAYWSRSDVGNIYYELGRQNIYANKATKVDTDKVVYEFKNNEVPSRRDEVTIEGLENHSKVKMEKTTLGLREVLDDIEPEIIEKKMTAKSTSAKTATVKLYFDKDVTGVFKGTSDNEFDVDAHFTLYEDEVATRYKSDEGVVASAKYDVDAAGEFIKDVIVVELEDLEIYNRLTNDLEYILEIEGFTNTTSSRYKMFRDYYEFKFTTSSNLVVNNGTVNYKGTEKTEITLNFSKQLDRATAENAANYVFYYENASGVKILSDDLADLDGKAELVGNGTKLILTVPEGWTDLIADFAGLRISDAIKDTAGNRLDETYYFDLVAELLVGKSETVAGALTEAKRLAGIETGKVTASTNAYTVVAGGLVTDKVYTNVTTAQIALQDLVSGNDTKAIRTATTTLTNALKALDDATAALLEGKEEADLTEAKRLANVELAKVAASTTAYITAGGEDTDNDYKAVTTAETMLKALLTSTDKVLIEEKTEELEIALGELGTATDVLVNQALVNAEAAAVALTLEATGNVDKEVLPVVGEGFTIAVKTTSAPAVYNANGEILETGISNVVYTVTHTASNLTAVTGTVVVTVTVAE